MINNISFPKLGLSFDINRVAFSIFNKEIYWYAIIIITGFLLASLFVAQSARKKGIRTEYIWDIALYGLVFGIIGARIYYCIFDFDTIRYNFWNIFKVWEGGLAIYGAIISAIITAYIYCRIKKLNVLEIFDLACQGLLIGQAVGRWGNFVNAEVFGTATSLPWGMSINDSLARHPLFLYESLWNVLGLVIILVFRKKVKTNGLIFFFYIAWYSFGRFFLEGMREAEFILKVTQTVGISQVVAVIGVLCGVIGTVILKIKSKPVEAEKIREETD